MNMDLFVSAGVHVPASSATRRKSPGRSAFASARLRKERGQFAAVRTAGPTWMASMLKLLRLFLADVKSTGNAEFTFEQFRNYCESLKAPAPASLNAWGAVPRMAAEAGLVEFTGAARNATRPASHGRLIKVWRAI